MQAQEVAKVIRELADWLGHHPNQLYKVQVQLTGVTVQASAPGSTGLEATAVGGSGGTVIGANIQPQFGDMAIQFAESKGDEAALEQIRLAAQLMEHVAAELETPEHDEGKIVAALSRLGALAVPAIVTETVRQLLRSVGLPV